MATKTTRRQGKPDEREVFLSVYRSRLSAGADNCEPLHRRAEDNHKYVAGPGQWDAEDRDRQQRRERPALEMNKIISVINAISGQEIVERFRPKVFPRRKEAAAWAQINDEMLRWQRDESESEHEETLAFREMAITGYGVVHKYFNELEGDGEGRVMDEQIPVWEMIWDPAARKSNLVDRRWHMRGKYIPMDEFLSEWGDSEEKEASELVKRLTYDNGMLGGRSSVEATDADSRSPRRWSWGSIAQHIRAHNPLDDEVFVVEYEWRERVFAWKAAMPRQLEGLPQLMAQLMADVQAGAIPPEQAQQMAAGMRDQILADTALVIYDTYAEFNAARKLYEEIVGEKFVDFAKTPKWKYQYAFLAWDVPLERGERFAPTWTYEFLTGFPYPDREKTTFYSCVDIMAGPQDWRNRFFSLALTMLATSPKGTLFLERSSVRSPDILADQFAKPGGMVFVDDGFFSQKRYEFLQPPRFPEFIQSFIDYAERGITDAIGMNPISLGQGQDLRRISGNVVQSVKQASITILALLFDSLRRFRKRSGRLSLTFLMHFYDEDTYAQVIDGEQVAFLPSKELWDGLPLDIKVDEEQSSVSEMMETWDFLTRTGSLDSWLANGWVDFDWVLDIMPGISEAKRTAAKARYQQKQMLPQLMQFIQQSQGGPEFLMQLQGGGAPQQQGQGPAAAPPQPPVQ